jgi:hypothetical protein
LVRKADKVDDLVRVVELNLAMAGGVLARGDGGIVVTSHKWRLDCSGEDGVDVGRNQPAFL